MNMLCELCFSEVVHNFHHYIPRTLHSNKWFKKRYTREQMQEGMNLCKSCHKAIHDLIPNEKKLGRHFNTMEKLLAHPQVAGYVKWKRERGQKAKSQEASHAEMPILRSQ